MQKDNVQMDHAPMGEATPPKGKHIFGTVKMGEKGQIVIPKAARDLFGLGPGSSLLVVGDEESGIALITDQTISNLLMLAMSGQNSASKDGDDASKTANI